MVQNSEVQKCAVIDVSLASLPPAENLTFPYVQRTLLGRIRTRELWFVVYVVWNICDDNIFLSPRVQTKAKSGPGKCSQEACLSDLQRTQPLCVSLILIWSRPQPSGPGGAGLPIPRTANGHDSGESLYSHQLIQSSWLLSPLYRWANEAKRS